MSSLNESFEAGSSADNKGIKIPIDIGAEENYIDNNIVKHIILQMV